VTSARPVARLAVIDPIGNPGGGTRFLRALLPALRRARPTLRVTLHGNAASIDREGIADELRAAGIEVEDLAWLRGRHWKSIPLTTRLSYKVRRRLDRNVPLPEAFIEANLVREIEAIRAGADLAYFPWPYRIPTPTSGGAVVCTIHDLNFKYFFGTPIYGAEDTLRLDQDIGKWLRDARAITSSQFMADDIARFYPNGGQLPVIRLATFSSSSGDARDSDRMRRSGLEGPYILCPTQMTVHKNVGPLIAAQAVLRDRFPHLRLVLTGQGTELATGHSTAIGSIRGNDEPDVIGLGYVSNQEMDDLIERATVVVNPSLYEAGNGPGLDAWSRGTPVAMSNIRSFTEHLDALGVEAAVFDPRDPEDIAAKVADILDRPDAWSAAAARSRAAIALRTWDQVAAEYLAVFDAAYEARVHG
jgi:glycosyltransferase involved in cell wall biosynthesis